MSELLSEPFTKITAATKFHETVHPTPEYLFHCYLARNLLYVMFCIYHWLNCFISVTAQCLAIKRVQCMSDTENQPVSAATLLL
jgi:hypothetical protein